MSHLVDERHFRQAGVGHGFVCRQKGAERPLGWESPPGDNARGALRQRHLDAARTLAEGNRPVFRMRNRRPIATSRSPKMLQQYQIAVVPCDCVSSSQDGGAEKTNQPRHIIVAALAQVIPEQGRNPLRTFRLFKGQRRVRKDEEAAGGVRNGGDCGAQQAGAARAGRGRGAGQGVRRCRMGKRR